jgi:hypothetical protein
LGVFGAPLGRCIRGSRGGLRGVVAGNNDFRRGKKVGKLAERIEIAVGGQSPGSIG